MYAEGFKSNRKKSLAHILPREELTSGTDREETVTPKPRWQKGQPRKSLPAWLVDHSPPDDNPLQDATRGSQTNRPSISSEKASLLGDYVLHARRPSTDTTCSTRLDSRIGVDVRMLIQHLSIEFERLEARHKETALREQRLRRELNELREAQSGGVKSLVRFLEADGTVSSTPEEPGREHGGKTSRSKDQYTEPSDRKKSKEALSESPRAAELLLQPAHPPRDPPNLPPRTSEFSSWEDKEATISGSISFGAREWSLKTAGGSYFPPSSSNSLTFLRKEERASSSSSTSSYPKKDERRSCFHEVAAAIRQPDVTPRYSTRRGSDASADRRTPRASEASLQHFNSAGSNLRNVNAFQVQVWRFLADPDSSVPAYLFSHAMNPFYVCTLLLALAQTTDEPLLTSRDAVPYEIACELIFAFDISLRFIACPSRLAFLFNGYNWIDMLSASPLLVRATVMIASDAENTYSKHEDIFKFLLYIAPIIRLLKLQRRFEQFHLVYTAFLVSFEAMPVLLYTIFFVVLFFSTLVLLVEPSSNITCLPEAIWLVVVTVSTVGYGDFAPESTAGKIIVTFLIFVSMLIVAIPVGIVGNAFNRVWEDRRRLLLLQRTRTRLYQWGYDARDIPSLFMEYGSEEGLNFHEFREMMNDMKLGMSDNDILELFSSFDEDGGGFIDRNEFVLHVFPEDFAGEYISRVEHLSDMVLSATSATLSQTLSRMQTSVGEDNAISRKITEEDFAVQSLPLADKMKDDPAEQMPRTIAEEDPAKKGLEESNVEQFSEMDTPDSGSEDDESLKHTEGMKKDFFVRLESA